MTDTVGVVLAAGEGERFEAGNKLLADLVGEPVVVHAARSLVDAHVDHVVAVLGHDADRVRDALADVVDETVSNPDYGAGQSTSVRRGVAAARECDAAAAVFLPGDVPCVDPDTVEWLVGALDRADADVVVPSYGGQRGNPVVFGAAHFDALAHLSGDVGGRVLLESVPVRRVFVSDPGILRDVDTVDDLETLRQSCDS